MGEVQVSMTDNSEKMGRYKFIEFLRTWSHSRDLCIEDGGDLAVFTTENERKFLKSKFS